MYTFVLTIQILTLLMSFIVIFVLLKRKPFRGQTTFLLLALAITVQSFGYLLEIQSTDINTVLISIKVQYLGSCYVNLLFLSFLFQHFHYKRNKYLFGSLFCFNTMILLLVCHCEFYKLYYSSMEFVQTGLFPHVVLGLGPMYLAFKVEVICVNSLIIGTLVYHYHYASKKIRKNDRHFILACLVPCITSMMYSIGVFEVYDSSSASFVISGVLILIAIYKNELFEIIHTARESVIDAMDEPLIVVDSEGYLLDHNPSAEYIFPELCGKYSKNISIISPFLDDLLHDRIPKEFERDNCCYQAQLTEIRHNTDIVGYSFLIFDVTEARSMMNTQIQLREQAEAANQAKTTFLANMSHDIRTPLNAILGLTDIMLTQDTSEQVKKEAVSIKNAGSTLLMIINDLLDLSKIESGKMTFLNQEYKLAAILQDVIGIAGYRLEHKPVTMRVQPLKPLIPYIMGDEFRLRQILINVLNNATKFTEEGSITLQIDYEFPDRKDPDKVNLIFIMTDTGPGIAPEDQERIFDSFEQLDTKYKQMSEGSGLGLAICRKLLTLIGGSITVTSAVGKGSRFRIVYPQRVYHSAPDESEQAASKKSSVQVRPIFHKSALIVDDNLLNLQVAKGLIALYGLTVTTADSGPTAVNLLKEQPYDIVFLDQMMPGMDGTMTLHEIRKLAPSYCKTIPIVALTANAVKGVRESFLREGYSDYLSKPMSQKALAELLTHWFKDNLC